MAQTGSETQRHSGHQIVTSISYCCRSILYPKYSYDKSCKHWYSKKDFSEHFETLRTLEVQSFISVPPPARGTYMFSRLLELNTWLQRTCSVKGVNFIDNFNLFWGHRQLFKQTWVKSAKGHNLLLPHHPSEVCSKPLNLNGTHTHLDKV